MLSPEMMQWVSGATLAAVSALIAAVWNVSMAVASLKAKVDTSLGAVMVSVASLERRIERREDDGK